MYSFQTISSGVKHLGGNPLNFLKEYTLMTADDQNTITNQVQMTDYPLCAAQSLSLITHEKKKKDW